MSRIHRCVSSLTPLSLLLAGIALMSGCVTKYPKSESALTYAYPLKYCDDVLLAAAATEMTKVDEPPVQSQKTVCVTAPGPVIPALSEADSEKKPRLEAQAFAAAERRLREFLERPFMPVKAAPSNFGIALSGGGSKAAAFATGVLAGLADGDLLDKADFISSVSGGGYAAYYYYAHRLFPVLRGEGRPLVNNTDLYRDCVDMPPSSIATRDVQDQIKRVTYCQRLDMVPVMPDSQPRPDIRYQAYLKCSQDVLRPGNCTMDTTGGIDRGISTASVAGTVLTFIPSWVPNILFDWGWSTSPSARSYRDGIGLASGATLADPDGYKSSVFRKRTRNCGPGAAPDDIVYDCTPGIFDPDPAPMKFEELRTGLLKLRQQDGKGLPFWIMNAAAPQSRTALAWLKNGRDDISNSDMFEMTAVSHGSGRYGYVSTSPVIHSMTVLDAVAASAAFLDGNQLVYKNRLVRTGAGLLLNAANTDWGLDIANYNVRTARRNAYRFLPIPLYFFDDYLFGASRASPEMRDRERSVFIRLMDGGNAENLGVYSLLKRGVKNILISDAAQDAHGLFGDICGLRQRLLDTPAVAELPRHLYVPGLHKFSSHCNAVKSTKWAYNLYGWKTANPILLGCIRKNPVQDTDQGSCQGLSSDDIRLFIAKPAVNLTSFLQHQLIGDEGRKQISQCLTRGLTAQNASLLNCDSATFLLSNNKRDDGRCPLFPQHSTVFATANSSATIFIAYRELARQYVATMHATISGLIEGDAKAAATFEQISRDQMADPLKPTGHDCPAY